MAAYEIPNLRFSGESAGAIARRRFVKFDTTGKVVQAAASTDFVAGVSSQPTTGAGQVAEIYDGIVMVEAGAAVPLLAGGSPVMVDSQGRAIAYVAGAGVNVAGLAITAAGAAGELLTVKIY
jgi:hypothetical protein